MFGLSGRQFLILLLVIGLFYVAAHYVPPYVTAFQFNDYIRQEVKFAATSRKTTENVRTAIVAKAKEMGIPIKPQDIRITRRGPSFTLELEYRFPIDLQVYQKELVFQTSESGETFENASY